MLQNEPFHPEPEPQSHNPVEDLAKGVGRFASSLAQTPSFLGKAFSPQAMKLSGTKLTSVQTSVTRPENVRIGDEINLLEEPWVEAHGVYSCKAIRRPAFIAEAIELAEQSQEQQTFSSPTAMFKSFAKSARSVLQDSFLMVTETHLVEMKSSKMNPTTATVTFCMDIELMHKLKFRRHESLSLFFKPAPDDPLVYMCPDSGDAVQQIQSVLKRHGVKGKHTNAAAHKAIAAAMQIVQEIQTKELALRHEPSVERVNDIMDLYRQAAELFENAGDIRHEEVVVHLRKFLALPLTVSILDGSFQKPEKTPKLTTKSPKGDVPEGEVLERTPCQLDDEDPSSPVPTQRKQRTPSDHEFEASIDNLLKEAQGDLEELKAEGHHESDPFLEGDDALADVAADLNAMLQKADAELAELMKS
jgi:hypothetical protein